MEDIYFPLHMMDLGFGDVAIPDNQICGIPFKPTAAIAPEDFKIAVSKFKCEGDH